MKRFRSTFRLVVATLVLVLLVFARPSSAAAAPDAVGRVRAAGILRWGADIQGGEPYVYDDPNHPGNLVGFEVDIANAIASRLGVRAEMVQNDWSNLVPSLERGTFDIALNGLEITEAWRGRVLFSRPYYVFAERLMARSGDASITDLTSLKGRRVGTLANSLAFEILRDRAETVLYEGVEEPYIDLEQGRTDAVLLDDIIAARYGAPHAGLRVVGDVREGYYAIAVRPSEPELRDAIDAALRDMNAKGELERILVSSGLWNERQSHEPPTSEAPPAPPPKLGAGHVVLFLRGALVTLVVSSTAMAIAMALGLGLTLARLYGRPWLARGASIYIEIYRGTPVLLQLYLLYYGLAPIFRLGAFPAAIIGLGMNYAAYEAEVYRAGIQAVPKAQLEASLALGMSHALALRRIILPQAFRHAIPNVTNDFIALLKDSSLVSVITVVELTKQMTITAVDVRSWIGPGLLCAGLYFAMSYPLGAFARRLEARLEGERTAET